jgi:hypothetical protein
LDSERHAAARRPARLEAVVHHYENLSDEAVLSGEKNTGLLLICSPIELDTDGAILLRQDGRASWASFHGSRTADASSPWSSSAVSSSSC